MNPQTPSYLDSWSIFLLLSQAGAMGKAVRQAESKYVTDLGLRRSPLANVTSTATTERLNLRTFFSWFLSSQILVLTKIHSRRLKSSIPSYKVWRAGPNKLCKTAWTLNTELRCEGAAAAVSATTNLKESLASLRWESERLHEMTMDVVRSAFGHHRFSEPTPAALGIAWAGARGIWKRFNTGELRTCCAK